jgi:hypothetical protein
LACEHGAPIHGGVCGFPEFGIGALAKDVCELSALNPFPRVLLEGKITTVMQKEFWQDAW